MKDDVRLQVVICRLLAMQKQVDTFMPLIAERFHHKLRKHYAFYGSLIKGCEKQKLKGRK